MIPNGTGNMVNILYRAALLAICGWALAAVLTNNERSVEMKSDIKTFNTSVSRIEGAMGTLVTKTELELTVIKLQNEQLKFQNEFLKATQVAQPTSTIQRLPVTK